jgi:AraC-like DNA-binding protein
MKQVPIYGIDKFNRKQEVGIQYQIEVFDKDRDFKVSYPHRHDDFYEILFITQGTGIYTIDFQQYEIKANTVFFLSPGQIHELQLSDDIKGFIFLFTSAFYHVNKADLYKLFELPFFYTLGKETPPLFLQHATEINLMAEFFKKAISENEQDLAEKDDAIRAFLDLILIHCKRLYPEFLDEKMSKGKLLVKRLKQLIEEKCQENFSVKEYAKLLNVTPSYLSETVKSLTGRTSSDLINDRMILEIKRMLVLSELTVSEIAFQLHFADQSYFSKYFKKLTQLSPLEFRAKAQKL